MSHLNPLWNKPIRETDRALDPLGMNRVSDRLLNDLLSGITTVTPRARYYSFYTWVVSEINKDKAATYAQFRTRFYDLERLFMLSCIAHEEETGQKDARHLDINGSQKGRLVWATSGDTIDLRFRYFGHGLGGYGQYYQGSIMRLGLITLPEEAKYEETTEFGLEESFSQIMSQQYEEGGEQTKAYISHVLRVPTHLAVLCFLVDDIHIGRGYAEQDPNVVARAFRPTYQHILRQWYPVQDEASDLFLWELPHVIAEYQEYEGIELDPQRMAQFIRRSIGQSPQQSATSRRHRDSI